MRATGEGWGLVDDPSGLFGPTIVRWYPTVQWFTGDGFADLLRSTSLYRRLAPDVREPLLDAVSAPAWVTVHHGGTCAGCGSDSASTEPAGGGEAR